jgi:hypothetical protein
MSKSKCPFKVEKWQASPTSIEFLDLCVYRPQNSSVLHFKPHVKPTSLGIPLSVDSAHVPSICKRWPISYIFRLAMNSSTMSEFAIAKKRFINRLVEHKYPPAYISSFMVCNPWSGVPKSHNFPQVCRSSKNKMWLCLEGHPLWQSLNLTSYANIVASDPEMLFRWRTLKCNFPCDFPFDFSIGVAWRLPGQHYSVHLRKLIQGPMGSG